MAAMLVWGKGFRTIEMVLPSGEIFRYVSGIDGGVESIAWSSVEEMERLVEQHGVSRSIWPVYPDCDVESAAPREDAQLRSAELRIALDRIDPRDLEANDKLKFIHKILREGNSFFVMI